MFASLILSLQNAGADMTRRNSSGNNPLHLASQANRLEALQELTNSDPDALNQANSLGQTPADVAGSPFVKEAAKPFRNAIVVVKAALRFGRKIKQNDGNKRNSGVLKATPRAESPPTPLKFRLSSNITNTDLDGF